MAQKPEKTAIFLARFVDNVGFPAPSLVENENVNKRADWLWTIFTLVMHAPIRTRKVRGEYAPWLTKNIKKEMNQRDYLKRMAVKTKSAYFHNAYKAMRNWVNNIEKSKIQHYHKCIDESKGNSKKMWKNINQLIGRGSKTTHIPSLSMGDEAITDESQIANELNKFFTCVGPDLSSQISETNITPVVKNNWTFFHI